MMMVELDQKLGKVSLTEREREILRLLTNGLTDSEIADAVILTVGTVKWYNRQIYSKLGVRNRVEAVRQAEEWHLLERPTRTSTQNETLRKQSYLPAQLTSFIGREHELNDLRNLLHDFRLVTLTGPPGTGKTRLALQTASFARDVFDDGVYFVSLAAIHDPNLVVNAIIQALNITVTGTESQIKILQDYVQDKHMLLVLDNFEHLLPAAPTVSQILALASKLTVLITSREALQLYGEYNYLVPPLQLPDLKVILTADSIKSCEAVVLFVQRASALVQGFALDDGNANSIAAICVHLDGLPLAIELAAARMKFYAPQMLLVRLSSRLDALNGGPRDLPNRQRTLRATLAWSYELLSSDEQRLFERLGIFAGGCAEKDVESVCGDALDLSVTAGLESLLNKHLIKQEQSSEGESRFIMLETMREYALEKLGERGEHFKIAEQHARYFIGKSVEAALVWSTPHEGKWLDWLETQHNNLRATLEWSLTHDPSAQTSLELIAHLARFWELRGYFGEGRAWLSKALNLAGSNVHTKAHADACFGISLLILREGDHGTAQQLCREAVEINQKLGDKRAVSFSLVRLSEVTSEMGDYDSALQLSQRAYSIACESGDSRAKANALCQIGFDLMRLGKYEQTQIVLKDAFALFEAVEDQIGVALAHSALGELAVRTGDLDMAMTSLQLSLRLREEFGDRWGIAAVLGTLAWVELIRKNFARAGEMLKESILIRKEIGEQGGIAWCLEKLANLAFLNQDAGGAARTLGAAAMIRERTGSTIDPCDREHHDHMTASLRKQLGLAVWEAVWSEGYSMNLREIICES
jgi:predicted ATPase/DNA-binding CsgD family transcriptional regulator